MEFDLTVTLTVFVTAIGALVTSISTLVWMRMSIIQQNKVLFSDSGEVRLMSYSAHERISDDCRRNLINEGVHLKQAIEKIEDYQAQREDKLAKEMSKLSEKIETLSECVTRLSAGIKC